MSLHPASVPTPAPNRGRVLRTIAGVIDSECKAAGTPVRPDTITRILSGLARRLGGGHVYFPRTVLDQATNVQQLHRQGVGTAAIAERLGITRRYVQRLLTRAPSGGQRRKPS